MTHGVYKPIMITQGTYSHITTLILISFVVMKSMVVKLHVDVHVWLTIGIPSHTIATTTLVPLDLGGGVLDNNLLTIMFRFRL
jgi:hypothetical protein